jgi:hypothetical protein
MEEAILPARKKNKRKSDLSTIEWISKFQARLPEYPVHPHMGMAYGTERKYLSWNFDPAVYKTLEILHITDTQFGHVECQVDRIQEYVEWVLRKRNRFVLLGGDMIDSATMLSIGSPWENISDPQGQVYAFCDLIAPLRGRVLGYVGGNHERRGIRTFGDLGLLLATLLKVPYSSGRQLIDIHYGGHKPFKIDLWHGRGASRTDGAKVMMVSNYVKDHPGSDLYLTGHLHDCFLFQKHREERQIDRMSVKIRKVYMGMSSSFLNTWGTYAEVSGMSITDVAMLRCVLTPDGHSEMTIR